jgi:hypothetical protein
MTLRSHLPPPMLVSGLAASADPLAIAVHRSPRRPTRPPLYPTLLSLNALLPYAGHEAYESLGAYRLPSSSPALIVCTASRRLAAMLRIR